MALVASEEADPNMPALSAGRAVQAMFVPGLYLVPESADFDNLRSLASAYLSGSSFVVDRGAPAGALALAIVNVAFGATLIRGGTAEVSTEGTVGIAIRVFTAGSSPTGPLPVAEVLHLATPPFELSLQPHDLVLLTVTVALGVAVTRDSNLVAGANLSGLVTPFGASGGVSLPYFSLNRP